MILWQKGFVVRADGRLIIGAVGGVRLESSYMKE